MTRRLARILLVLAAVAAPRALAAETAAAPAKSEAAQSEDADSTPVKATLIQTSPSPSPLPPSHVAACVTAAEGASPANRPHHWDPRSGYGLCQEICGQGEACVDARCVVRCIPDCREGTYCTADSECLPVPKVGGEQPTEGELQARLGATSAAARHAVLLDVGGVLFMGARPTLEWGARHSLHVRALLMNTGLMPYFLEPQSAAERFEWGFGASVGYRHYEARWGNLRGFYWGLGLDYSVTEVRDPFETLVATVTHYAGGYGEFGYRWVFGDFLFGFGPSLAVKAPFLKDQRPLPGGGSCLSAGTCPRDTGARVEGTMVVEVGWLE